jgi:hypothetical protein
MPAVGVHGGAIRLSPHVSPEGLGEAPPRGISKGEAPRPRRHRNTGRQPIRRGWPRAAPAGRGPELRARNSVWPRRPCERGAATIPDGPRRAIRAARRGAPVWETLAISADLYSLTPAVVLSGPIPAASRVSSVVEQRFCKPLVGSSNLSPGTGSLRPSRDIRKGSVRPVSTTPRPSGWRASLHWPNAQEAP